LLQAISSHYHRLLVIFPTNIYYELANRVLLMRIVVEELNMQWMLKFWRVCSWMRTSNHRKILFF